MELTGASRKKILKGMSPSSEGASTVAFVARQPIFDKGGRVQAYELLFRDPTHRDFASKNSHAATSAVIMDGFNLMRPSLAPGQKCFINFTEELIEADTASILPPDICVVEVLETCHPTDDLLSCLHKLKAAGYTLALDDFCGQQHLVPFLPLVNIVKIDILATPEDTLRRLAEALRHRNILLAEKVEDMVMESCCRQLGFSLFQGFFFSKAEVVSGKKITPTQITKARLLAFASDEKATVHDIAEAISVDIYLTVKLLNYVNSVHFGLPEKVKTIDHALAILGKEKVRQWLYVTTLADMDSAPLACEVAYVSALRAKFLELLGWAGQLVDKAHTPKPDVLFLLGLFSMLDRILGIPFKEITKTVPMFDDIVAAFTQKQGPLAPWLEIICAFERGQWEQVYSITEVLKVSDKSVQAAYAEAAAWSSKFFGPN